MYVNMYIYIMYILAALTGCRYRECEKGQLSHSSVCECFRQNARNIQKLWFYYLDHVGNVMCKCIFMYNTHISICNINIYTYIYIYIYMHVYLYTYVCYVVGEGLEEERELVRQRKCAYIQKGKHTTTHTHTHTTIHISSILLCSGDDM